MHHSRPIQCYSYCDILGIHILSLAARHRTAANWGTLANGLAKIHAAREYDRAPINALSPEWKEKFLHPSMTQRRRMKLCVAWIILEELLHSPNDKKHKAATTLLRDEIPKAGLCQTCCFTCHQNPWTQSVDSALHRFCLRCVMHHGLLAPG